MKRFYFSFVLVLLTFPALSKNYKGLVTDTGGKPVAYANIIARNCDDMSLITGVITDEEGNFEIGIDQPVSFYLTISFIGYESWSRKILDSDDTNLGIITLTESKNELKEVRVLSRIPTIKRKTDRLIFRVQNSVVSSGGDAIDVLQKTPGVRIERDQIQLIGKNSVKVLINNRLSPLSGGDLSAYLRTLSSEDILRIEVISNPPAKFEAEGNSGLINIVLKKVKRDYFGGNIRSTLRQGTHTKGTIGGGLTYQKNKISLFSNINSGKGSAEVVETNQIFYPENEWDTDSKILYFSKFLSGRAGIDYMMNEKCSFGIHYLASTSRPDNKEKTTSEILNSLNAIDSLLITTGNTDNTSYYHSLNGHFNMELDSVGKSMSFDIDYFIFDNSANRLNNTQSWLSENQKIDESDKIFKNISNQDIKNISTRLDFNWPTKISDFKFGGKLSFIKNDSKTGAFDLINNEFVTNLGQTNSFKYTENTQALYFSAIKTLGKWDLQLGMRVEFTQTEGNSHTLSKVTKNDYEKFFPTAYITYNPSDRHSWSLSYGRRINRPDYASLNPFRWFSNPYSYSEGNPFLKPSFVNNLEFSNLYNRNLNTALYLSIQENGSDQLTFTDKETKIQATVRRNFLDSYDAGLFQSYTFDKMTWFETYAQYNLSYSKIKSNLTSTINEQDGFSFYASLDNTFYLNPNKTIMAELNLSYSSPMVSGVDKISESYSADIGMKLQLLKKRLQFNIVFTDMFKTDINTIKSTVNSIRQRYRNYYDSRQLRFSLVYRFGNKNLRSKQKKFSNEEERKRALN